MKNMDVNLDESVVSVTDNQKKEKSPSRLKKIFKNKYFLLTFIGIIGVIVVGVSGFYYIIYTGRQTIVDVQYELLTALKIEPKLYALGLSEPPEVKEIENPLNGTFLSKAEYEDMKSRAVIGVMVNNHVAARPQSGLSKADIVYEALAEAGITRYLAIFWGPESLKANEVGPIRSIRQYFVDWALEYKVPVVMHIGWAGYDPGIDTKIVPEADARSYILNNSDKIKSLQSSFWRDDSRVSPHNAYNSIPNILKVAEANKWGNQGIREAYKFKKDAVLSERPETSTMDLTFLSSSVGDYSVRWVYDKATNSYLRTLGGKVDVDKATGQQLRTKNIVIQKTPYALARDEHARILLTTVGSGEAQYMIDGLVKTGTWSKASKTANTIFKDSSGKEIEFNRGQIWIEIVPVDKNNEVIGILNVK